MPLPPVSPRSIDALALRDGDRAILRKFEKTRPVPIGALAKEFGIRARLASLDTRCSGTIVNLANVFTVRVNRREAFCRQRYTLALCTAHALLQREAFPEGAPVEFDTRYRSAIPVEAGCSAADLARAMLLPFEAVRTDWAEAGRPTDWDGLAALAEQWKVCGPALRCWPFDQSRPASLSSILAPLDISP